MPEFDDHGLKGGVWRGRLTDPAGPPPRVLLVHHGEVLAQGRLTAEGDTAWLVAVDLPSQVLSNGFQTLLLTAGDGPGDPVLARLTLLAGQPFDEDMASEISALRAELELVKRELRRFAAGISGR